MSFELIVFIVLIVLTLFNNGVQAYIHFNAYPLLAYVRKEDFGKYLSEYEKRLMFPLMLPYGLMVLSNVVLIFTRPGKVSVAGVIVALLLNLAVATTTVVVATPVYNRIKAAGQAAGDDMSRLTQINLLRLLLSTASSLVVLFLLLTALSG